MLTAEIREKHLLLCLYFYLFWIFFSLMLWLLILLLLLTLLKILKAFLITVFMSLHIFIAVCFFEGLLGGEQFCLFKTFCLVGFGFLFFLLFFSCCSYSLTHINLLYVLLFNFAFLFFFYSWFSFFPTMFVSLFCFLCFIP